MANIKKVNIMQLRSLPAKTERDRKFKNHFLEGAEFSENLFGYYVDEKLAAFISFTKYQTDGGGIDYLYVSPDFRGKKLGTELIDFAIKTMDVHKVWVTPLDEQVQNYYQLLGFNSGKHDALIKMIS